MTKEKENVLMEALRAEAGRYGKETNHDMEVTFLWNWFFLVEKGVPEDEAFRRSTQFLR